MKPITHRSALSLLAASIISISAVGSASASSLTQVTNWGTLDPACLNEGSACAPDAAFTRSDASTAGGYRIGGNVSWSFVFDTSAFASISNITMSAIVVGLWPALIPNTDPLAGPMGSYFGIDGSPFAPIYGVTDGRDTITFDLTSSLLAGPHTFSVVAFEGSEGWAGVDVASLTVTGQSAVPVPAAAWLLGSGLLGLAGVARRKAA